MKFKWLLLLLFLGAAAYFLFYKTGNVWNNMSFINQLGEKLKLDSSMVNRNTFHPDSLISRFKSNSQSWQIGILADQVIDTVGGQINIDETYVKSILADSSGFQYNFLKMIFTSKLSDTLSDQEKELIVKNITSGKISVDSAYTLYIEEWVGTDSISIEFLKDR